MIYKLAGMGYLQLRPYEIIQLTESGKEDGRLSLNRHETVEGFLKLIGEQQRAAGKP
jgi:Mn-dependent DtxR family transcriptional regulator